MEQSRQFVGVAGDPVRRAVTGRRRDFLRIIAEFADQVQLKARRQAGQVGPGRTVESDSGFGHLAEDAGDPGVRVLHIVHRVFVRMRFGQVQVKVQLAVERAHDEEIPRRVPADFFDEFAERDALAGPFGHLDQLTALVQRHHLQDQHFQPPGVVAQSSHGGFHAGDVAMVVGAPDVDDFFEAAAEFVVVIGDVGGEVSGNAVVPDNDPVLVVAEIGAAQPERTVLVISVALFPQLRAGGGHRIIGEQRTLAEPDVEGHAEGFQVFLQRRQFFLQGDLFEDLAPLGGTDQQIATAGVVDDPLGGVDDIFAVVAVFRELHSLSQELQIAGFHRSRQIVDLVAGVVDVEFFLDVVAGGAHQVGQGTAEGRAAAVSDMQRAGRVGADELNLDLLPAAGLGVTVSGAGVEDFLQQLMEPVRFQIKIDKTRSGDFRAVQPGKLDPPHDRLGDLPGIGLEGPGRLHGEIGGVVTEALLRRHFQKHFRQRALRQCAVAHGRRRGPGNRAGQFFLYIHALFLLRIDHGI